MEKNNCYISPEEAITRVKAGKIIIITDDESRENEGDLFLAAEFVTKDMVHFMAKYGRGLICQPILPNRARELNLPCMTEQNTSAHATAFTISVDAQEGTTTGISASDRAATIACIINPETQPEDLLRPGHIFPLIADPDGILARPGHTEAAIELSLLAGLYPSGIICEILAEDGNMARGESLYAMAKEHKLGILTIKDLQKYITEHRSSAELPTDFGTFHMTVFPGEPCEREDFILTMGNLSAPENPLVRIHSECITGESLLSQKCDCGFQLKESMRLISEEGCGCIIYLRQEGRGIGLEKKIRAYRLQELGLDTFDANTHQGLPADARKYTKAVNILKELGITRLRLLTNNPDKIQGLEENGITVSERVPLIAKTHEKNRRYLETKKKRFGHLLEIF